MDLNKWYYTTPVNCVLVDGTSGSKYQMRLAYKLNSQTASTLKSNITVKIQVRTTDSEYWTSGWDQTSKINGTTLDAEEFSVRTKNTWVDFGTRTFDVTHTEKGVGKVTLSGSFTTNVTSAYGYALKSGSTTHNLTLPDILVKGTATIPAFYVGDGASLIISQKNSSLLATVKYTFGSLSGTIAAKVSAGTYLFSYDADAFRKEMPDDDEKTGVVTIETFTSDGTSLGTNSSTFTAKIKAAEKPKINSVTYRDSNTTITAITQNDQIIVKNKSAITIDLDITIPDGTTLKQLEARNIDSGMRYYYTTTGKTFTLPISLSASQRNDLYSIDKREHTSDAFVFTIPSSNFVAYENIQIFNSETKVKRTNNLSEDCLLTLNGIFYNGNIGATANSLKVYYQYRAKGTTTWSEAQEVPAEAITITTDATTNIANFKITQFQLNGTFSYEDTFEIQVYAEDVLMTTTPFTVSLPSGEILVSWHKKYADFLGLKVGGKELLDITYPVGSVFVSSTNENPANYLGGTWILTDKEFVNLGSGAIGYTETAQVKNTTAAFTRSGHSIVLNLAFTTVTPLKDEEVSIGTINFAELGITRLTYNTRAVGYGDNGDAILMLNINATTGEVTVVDIVGADTVAAGIICYATIPFQLLYTYILDEKANKFYWKRTA